jgi:hypothetical protein
MARPDRRHRRAERTASKTPLTAAFAAKQAREEPGPTLPLGTKLTSPLRDARDARFAMAKEQSRQPKLGRVLFDRSRSHVQPSRDDCLHAKAVVRPASIDAC